jgi:hypothetical protein
MARRATSLLLMRVQSSAKKSALPSHIAMGREVLSDIGLKVMWEKQRTHFFHTQSEEGRV